MRLRISRNGSLPRCRCRRRKRSLRRRASIRSARAAPISQRIFVVNSTTMAASSATRTSRGNDRPMQRRTLLKLAAGAAMLPALPPIVRAQAFPSRPVRMVVPVGPGGAPDIIARLIGQSLSERLGQSFVVENRPAGAGNVGTVEVVKAAPDGYTLLVMSPSHATFVTLYERLPYNTLRDLAPVAGLIRSINVLVLHPSVPARTVPELIAYAKANPGKLSVASTGVGGNPHLAGELFKLVAGIDMVHVPYRSPAAVMTDLLSGQVQVYFASTSSASEYVRTGKLRAIAVAAAMRSEALPDVPTIGEFLPGFEVKIGRASCRERGWSSGVAVC